MRNKIIALFTCTMLVACGTTENQIITKKPEIPPAPTTNLNKIQQRMLTYLSKYVEVDPEVFPHAAEFVARCSIVGGEFTKQCEKRLMILDKIEMVSSFDDAPNVVGRCYFSTSLLVPRTVQILRGFVNSDSLSMKGLIFHELGHCLLGQDHVSQNPLDIMSPFMLREDEYGSFWKILMQGLFNPVRLPNEKDQKDSPLIHEDTVESLGGF
jgi:hypothetical protein